MQTQEARRRLRAERDRLEELRAGILEQHSGGEPEPAGMSELSTIDQHIADLGTETFEREKDQSILARIQTELGEIDRAESKLGAGEYGTCEVCGRPIGDERLQAFPAARFCVDDQAGAEREGLPPNRRG